ncbi:MAG TPA: PDR/VanB family oxidoreductase [Pseudolysinimonas sp.]|nr:PDR/VanB family oxidoreductase [Pseudolysinimonas sp.]
MTSRQLRVSAIRDLPGRVRTVTLEPLDGKALPSFAPGSNIGLQWSDKLINSYSLVGDHSSPASYQISVLAQPEGSGGSLWVHNLQLGEVVTSTGVRSAFAPVAIAKHHVLVAAGIGVTPVLSHARWHARWGHSFDVYYVHRPGQGAHLDELQELCGDRLHTYASRTEFWAEFPQVLATQPFGTHIYTCGPLAMIDSVAQAAAEASWPEGRVHSEAFSSAALDAGKPFTAIFARSGRTVTVPSGASMLEAAEEIGIKAPYLCRQGLCGECRVSVIAGRVDHRDLVMGAAEKEDGNSMMVCVSRAADDLLEVDL